MYSRVKPIQVTPTFNSLKKRIIFILISAFVAFTGLISTVYYFLLQSFQNSHFYVGVCVLVLALSLFISYFILMKNKMKMVPAIKFGSPVYDRQEKLMKLCGAFENSHKHFFSMDGYISVICNSKIFFTRKKFTHVISSKGIVQVNLIFPVPIEILASSEDINSFDIDIDISWIKDFSINVVPTHPSLS